MVLAHTSNTINIQLKIKSCIYLTSLITISEVGGSGGEFEEFGK